MSHTSVMEEYNLQMEPILERELYTTPPLMSVVVATMIGTSQDIPRAFKLTKEMVAMSELRHLRRIRTLPDSQIECIICKVRLTNIHRDINSLLKDLETRFASEKIFKDYKVVRVPSSAPRTDQQLKACSEIWPCKFAKSNYLINCINGTVFGEAERIVINVIVRNVLHYLRENSGQHRAAAIVFRCAKIYGIGLSNSETLQENPTMHSTMLAIDSVATNQGSGHWKTPHNEVLMNRIQDQLDNDDRLKEHRIDANFLPYLCTNYDMFVTEEPCFACSMGLIQSRIRRLFYLDNTCSDQGGPVASFCKKLCYPDKAIEGQLVHRDKDINHRFEAWKVSIKDS